MGTRELRDWLLRHWGYLERRDLAREEAARAEQSLREAIARGEEVAEVSRQADLQGAINHIAQDVRDALRGHPR